jgi:hypothetical protein
MNIIDNNNKNQVLPITDHKRSRSITKSFEDNITNIKIQTSTANRLKRKPLITNSEGIDELDRMKKISKEKY